MSDIFLQRYYNNIKDPSWPKINNYFDFLKLPKHIQDECKNIHQLDIRTNQIESQVYWQKSLATVYRYKNLAFMPVPKCASSYYRQVFYKELGWEPCNFTDLEPGTICFSIVDEPLKRYLKGITEWVWNHVLPAFDYDLSKVPKSILKTTLIGDVHSLPYTLSFGTIMNQINFIPMHNRSSSQIIQDLDTLFKKLNHNIDIPDINIKIHDSSDLKLELYNLVKDIFENYRGDEKYVVPKVSDYVGRGEYSYVLLANDLKFYRNLVNSYDPLWQQIKVI